MPVGGFEVQWELVGGCERQRETVSGFEGP